MRASVAALGAWVSVLLLNGLCIALARVVWGDDMRPSSALRRLRLVHSRASEWVAPFCCCALLVEHLAGFWAPDAVVMFAGTAAFFAHLLALLCGRGPRSCPRVAAMCAFYACMLYFAARTVMEL